MKINKYNAEGYYDPTTYEALLNIHRDEYTKRREQNFRPLVFICSPYAGDIQNNTAKAQCYCRFAVDSGYIPLAPHLLYPQFMDESDRQQRELGLFFGLVLMSKCRELWVFGDNVTQGMLCEIKKATSRGMKIRWYDDYCREVKI